MTADITPARITLAADREQHPAGPALDLATVAALTDLMRARAEVERARRPIVLHGPETAPAPAHPGISVTIPSPRTEQADAGRRLYTGAEVAHLAALAGTGASLTGVGVLLAPGLWALAAPVVCVLAALGARAAMHERAAVQTLRTGHDRHGRPIAEQAAITARR